jgi:predicted PurR-regulated permease PerM
MMTSHFHLGKATLFFLLSYLAVGAVWYGVEETVSPLAASAVTCLLVPPVYWLGSRMCLRAPRKGGAFLLGLFWCVSAVVLDVILWVEPLGLLSGPLVIDFSPEYFYLDRYFPFLFIMYGEMLGTPILYASIRGRRTSPRP